MVLSFVCFSLLAQLPDRDEKIGAAQFSRILDALHGKIKDVSFVCEGTNVLYKPELLHNGRTTKAERYQSSFTYRDDNSARIEFYKRGDAADSLFMHISIALLGKKLERRDANPDTARIAPIAKLKGNPTAFNFDGAPHQFLMLWYFKMFRDLASMSFTHQGWETVNGVRCMKVEIDMIPGNKLTPRRYARYWIDREHGGHPVQIEGFLGEQRVWLTHDVELSAFDAPSGDKIWLPVDAVVDVFQWATREGPAVSKTPILRSTYHVVKSTLRLNQGLSDSHFSLMEKRTQTGPYRSALRREFDDVASQPPPPMFRSDPESVTRQLDQRLKEAEVQSEMIESTSDVRAAWGWGSVAPVVIGFCGVGCLLIASTLYRRAS